MNNDVLKIASTYLPLITIILSVIALLRGHNQPGGGFIGGIMLAAGFILYGMAHGYEQLKKTMYFNPTTVMLSGIIVAAISALAGIIANKTFFEGLWIKMEAINFKIGTPLLFDIGVYLAVYGVLMMIFATVMEELKWK